MSAVFLDRVPGHVVRIQARSSRTSNGQERRISPSSTCRLALSPPSASLRSATRFSGFTGRCQGRRRRDLTVSAASESDLEAETVALEIEKLERELELAVQTEDYSTAAGIRDRLRVLQDNEEAAVIAANSLFYRAFQGGNMRQMRQIWAREDHVQCIHPGTNCIQGYDMVLESWDVVLSGERRLSIDVENVRCYIRGSMAFVTCIEALRSDGASGRVIATNIFEKKDGKWFLVLHQGAPAPPPQSMF